MAFCAECGNRTEPNAKFCSKCGNTLGDSGRFERVSFSTTPISSPRVIRRKFRSNGVAIGLALFFGYWTWLYTYKKDAWKFWLGISITGIGVAMYYFDNPSAYLALSALSPIWVWSLIESIIKPIKWYDSF